MPPRHPTHPLTSQAYFGLRLHALADRTASQLLPEQDSTLDDLGALQAQLELVRRAAPRRAAPRCAVLCCAVTCKALQAALVWVLCAACRPSLEFAGRASGLALSQFSLDCR